MNGFYTAEYARTLSMPYKFGSGVIVHPARVQWLRDAVANDTLTPRMKTKWNTVMSRPASHTLSGPIDPWSIPENYSDDSEANHTILAQIRADTQPAVDYAWRYLVFGDETDAQQVVKILNAYSTIQTFDTNPGSTLNWYDGWALLIQAALMISKSSAYTSTVSANFKAATLRALNTLEPIAYTRTNNWAAWGLVTEILSASLFKDRDRFDRAVVRWRQLFDNSVKSGIMLQGEIRNNIPIAEIYRMGPSQGNGAYGLLYSNFHLAGMTIAAEYARLNGEWLFDHVSPDGSSLKGYYEQCVYWTRNPTFDVLWFNTSDEEDPSHHYYRTGAYTNRILAYVDILGALWPNEDADSLMEGTRVVSGVTQPSYDITQDYYGFRGAELAYRHRPLYG